MLGQGWGGRVEHVRTRKGAGLAPLKRIMFTVVASRILILVCRAFAGVLTRRASAFSNGSDHGKGWLWQEQRIDSAMGFPSSRDLCVVLRNECLAEASLTFG